MRLDRLARLRGVGTAGRVAGRYFAESGGLLAGGLAYAALFALVPALVLVVGIAGVVLQDPADRVAVVDLLATVLPPLREVLTAILADAVGAAGPVTLVGAVFLAWGASRFVISFEEALARVMGTTSRRGLIATNLVAFAAVALMTTAVLATAVTAGIATFADAARAAGLPALLGDAVQTSLGLAPPVVAGAALAGVYRYGPVPGPSWRAVGPPTVVVGFVLAVMTRVFVLIAPRLIGAAAVVGALASAFVALAWLSLCFQAILVGAAWVRVRQADEAAPD